MYILKGPEKPTTEISLEKMIALKRYQQLYLHALMYRICTKLGRKDEQEEVPGIISKEIGKGLLCVDTLDTKTAGSVVFSIRRKNSFLGASEVEVEDRGISLDSVVWKKIEIPELSENDEEKTPIFCTWNEGKKSFPGSMLDTVFNVLRESGMPVRDELKNAISILVEETVGTFEEGYLPYMEVPSRWLE